MLPVMRDNHSIAATIGSAIPLIPRSTREFSECIKRRTGPPTRAISRTNRRQKLYTVESESERFAWFAAVCKGDQTVRRTKRMSSGTGRTTA
ncbi:hypothetical protein VTN49DRAFT_7399 [Thermomyces lanuginosus]|uniref:uncharacterized protein n=1 Tax=Thermomyces lanuginosus TaxID=5541 RepID=UPI0037431C28